MTEKLSSSAQKVQDALDAFGISCNVVEMSTSTRTAKEAADAVGCQVGQIIKSLVFKGKISERGILALVSGANRVDEAHLGEQIGEPIEKADANFVREKTGYAIGGVPPIAHATPLLTVIDKDLLSYDSVWAAAGTPNAVFRIGATDLPRISNGKVVSVK